MMRVDFGASLHFTYFVRTFGSTCLVHMRSKVISYDKIPGSRAMLALLQPAFLFSISLILDRDRLPLRDCPTPNTSRYGCWPPMRRSLGQQAVSANRFPRLAKPAVLMVTTGKHDPSFDSGSSGSAAHCLSNMITTFTVTVKSIDSHHP